MPSFSNTKVWELPVDEIFREVTERVGGKWDSAEEVDSAIRSLNLVAQELMNRGKPLFTVERKDITIVTSVGTYSVSNGVMQALGAVFKTTVSGSPATDLVLNRVGFLDFHNISKKETYGQPSLYTVEQTVEGLNLKIWPVPVSTANTTYGISYYAVEAPDTFTQLFQKPEFNRRYYPVIVDGLAYNMALKRPDIGLDRIALFKQKFEESVTVAFREDREQVSHVVTPRVGWYSY